MEVFIYVLTAVMVLLMLVLVVVLVDRARAKQPSALTRFFFTPLGKPPKEGAAPSLLHRMFGVQVDIRPASPPSLLQRIILYGLILLPLPVLILMLSILYYHPPISGSLAMQITSDGTHALAWKQMPRPWNQAGASVEQTTLHLFDLRDNARERPLTFDGGIDLIHSSPDGLHLLVRTYTDIAVPEGQEKHAQAVYSDEKGIYRPEYVMEILDVSDGRRTRLGAGRFSGNSSWLNNDRILYTDDEGPVIVDSEGRVIARMGNEGRRRSSSWSDSDSLIVIESSYADTAQAGSRLILYNHNGEEVGRIDGMRGPSAWNRQAEIALYGDGVAAVRHAGPETFVLTALGADGALRDLMPISGRTVILGGLKSLAEIVLLDFDAAALTAVSAIDGRTRTLADLREHGDDDWLWEGFTTGEWLRMAGFKSDDQGGRTISDPEGEVIRVSEEIVLLFDQAGRLLRSAAPDGRYLYPAMRRPDLWLEWEMGYWRRSILGDEKTYMTLYDAAKDRTLDLAAYDVYSLPIFSEMSSGDRLVFARGYRPWTGPAMAVFNTEAWTVERTVDVLASERSLFSFSGITYWSAFFVLLAAGFNLLACRRRSGDTGRRALMLLSGALSMVILTGLLLDHMTDSRWMPPQFLMSDYWIAGLITVIIIGAAFSPALLFHISAILPQTEGSSALTKSLSGPIHAITGGAGVVRLLVRLIKYLIYLPPCLVVIGMLQFLINGTPPGGSGSLVAGLLISIVYLPIVLYVLIRRYATASAPEDRQRQAPVAIGIIIGLMSLPLGLVASAAFGQVGEDVFRLWAFLISPALVLCAVIYASIKEAYYEYETHSPYLVAPVNEGGRPE